MPESVQHGQTFQGANSRSVSVHGAATVRPETTDTREATGMTAADHDGRDDGDRDDDASQRADPRNADEAGADTDFAPDEVRMDAQPVLKLALWVYQHHAPAERGRCPVCASDTCDPYRWADEILTAVAAVPLVVIRGRPS